MSLYLATTHDEYELPVAVADSPSELAMMLGTTANCISSSISHKRPYLYRVEEPEGVEEPEDWWPTNEGQLWTYNEKSEVIYID